MRKSLKVYVVCMKLTAYGKKWYPGEVKSIGDEEILYGKIDRISDSFVWPEKEDLAW